MLAKLLNEDVLRSIAGHQSFTRGADYYADGNVLSIEEQNDSFAAKVQGTHLYHVEVWVDADGLAFECDCPMGEDLNFCKHCVAASLAWLGRPRRNGNGSKGSTKKSAAANKLRAQLLDLDKNALVELLTLEAARNPDFRDRLLLNAAQQNGKPPDFAAFRTALDKAIAHRDAEISGRMPEYRRRIEGVLDSINNLLEQGHANEVRELAERGLVQMEIVMEYGDDSYGSLRRIVARVEEMHLAACLAGKPDLPALAKILFELEIKSSWEVLHHAAATYADVLGKKGLAEYRKIAEAHWAKVPPPAPHEYDPDSYGQRSRIAGIMEALAQNSGDLEALIAIKSRDLSKASNFLEIAQVYKQAGNAAAALEWAERGARTFADNSDYQLREFLIAAYHSEKRHDDAIALAWKSFKERPGLDSYKILHKSASRAEQWPEWRKKALARLREKIAREKARESKFVSFRFAPDNHSDLVEIYLWEDDLETAWREAKSGGCHEQLWFRLARLRGKDHPEDAIGVYKQQLERVLEPAEPHAYKKSVDILREIYKLASRVGQEREFATLVMTVRVQCKARTSLMKLLDAEKW
jgi:uncharacterized Zn finger protein